MGFRNERFSLEFFGVFVPSKVQGYRPCDARRTDSGLRHHTTAALGWRCLHVLSKAAWDDPVSGRAAAFPSRSVSVVAAFIAV